MSDVPDNAAGLLRYLAECYRESGSRAGITSLESSRVHGSVILDGRDEIVTDTLLEGQIFVRGKRAATLATNARLHEKDRDLFYGSIFFVGQLESGGPRRKPAFAPLLLYPVTVSAVMDGEGAEFLVDTSRTVLNYALFELLGDQEFVEKVEAAVADTGHTEACVSDLQKLLQSELPDLNCDSVCSYPILLNHKELRSHYTEIEEGGKRPVLAAGAALFLANKSVEMRGILNDLSEMAEAAEQGTLSAPIRALLGDGKKVTRALEFDDFGGQVPAILSPAQESVLESAGSHPITLAVGPPGTGKSFTIAALAIEAMSRGESVLIASKMDHAVDVVAEKIEESLGLKDVCVRAGRKSYLKELKKFFENLLSGFYQDPQVNKKWVNSTKQRVASLNRSAAKVEKALERKCRTAEKRGEILSRPAPGVFTRWRQKRIRKAVAKETPIHRIAGQLNGLFSQRIESTVDYLKRLRTFYLNGAVNRFRPTFLAFNKGIRARTTHKKEEYFTDVNWKGLLLALPVWLSKLSDLHRVIPLKHEQFDLVIIDEASQCDMASALPALARAKRAVITGDPKQLRHISFLPVARQKELATLHGLYADDADAFDFRRVSLVDLVSAQIRDQKQVVFLNEHFRSRPEIIAFSNREFYSEQLSIMTGHREVDRHGAAPLTLHRINGARSANGSNRDEIDAVIAQVEELTAEGKPALSIGILSPFRAQVEAILKRIEKHPRAQHLLNRHNLLVGTAHSFQGEEKDVMFLTFAVDDRSPAASYRFMEREDVFNVAITRARIENRIFISFEPGDKGRGLVARFIEHARKYSHEESAPNPVSSRTQQGLVAGQTGLGPVADVIRALENCGYEVIPQFSIGGYEVDLLCSKEGESLGIDLIGFPGVSFEAVGLERYLALRRAGIRLIPVSLAEWEVRRDEVLRLFGG